MSRSRRPAPQATSKIVTKDVEPGHVQVLPGETEVAQPLGTIPEHVQSIFMQAAELAATRLYATMNDDEGWKAMRPQDQKAFIELAFLRAFGAPLSKSLSVELSSSDADAVAASLANMHAQLPEQRQRITSPESETPSIDVSKLPKAATRRRKGK